MRFVPEAKVSGSSPARAPAQAQVTGSQGSGVRRSASQHSTAQLARAFAYFLLTEQAAVACWSSSGHNLARRGPLRTPPGPASCTLPPCACTHFGHSR